MARRVLIVLLFVPAILWAMVMAPISMLATFIAVPICAVAFVATGKAHDPFDAMGLCIKIAYWPMDRLSEFRDAGRRP